jgi:hypothetical protein
MRGHCLGCCGALQDSDSFHANRARAPLVLSHRPAPAVARCPLNLSPGPLRALRPTTRAGRHLSGRRSMVGCRGRHLARWLWRAGPQAAASDARSGAARAGRHLPCPCFPVTRVVLASAHLDHDPGNSRSRNLAALCQRCHMLHDGAEHRRRWWSKVVRLRTLGDLFD